MKGKYTIFNGEIDRQIDLHMDLVVQTLNKKIDDIEAVILIGGYARGEGTVRIKDNVVHPVNDYDFYIISKKPISIPKEKLNELSVDLSKKITGTKFSYTSSSNLMNFYVDFRNMTTKELATLPPLIKYYEMKHSGTVIYGSEDVLEAIPNYKIEQIPKQDGVRFLFNRMSLLIEFFRTKYVVQDMSLLEKETLLYFISKMHLTITEALLLLSEKFVPSYSGRAKIFEKSYKEDFPELYEKIPNLTTLVNWATNLKLNFDESVNMEIDETVDLWFKTRDNLKYIVEYYFWRLFRATKQIDWIKNPEILIKTVRTEFYMPYINWLIKAKVGFSLNYIFLKGLSFAAQEYLNYLYYKELKNLKNVRHLKIFKEYTDPGLKIYSALPHILYALNQDGSENQQMLRKGIERLEMLQPKTLKQYNWDSTAKYYGDVFRIYQFLM